jgi:hypothetical protein
MAFRADEAAANGLQEAKSYLVPRQFTTKQRKEAEEALQEIVAILGPVVDAYPIWHPLIANHDRRNTVIYPSEQCGYYGLEHTRYFAHGFITCPNDDGKRVIDSVNQIAGPPCASIIAERLDVPFYSAISTPILVRCEWSADLEPNRTIPKKWAVPLMLEQELPTWRWAQRGETWETMRPYLLGQPHGNRSSLFVTQETALAIKNMYVAMNESGMFGAVKV